MITYKIKKIIDEYQIKCNKKDSGGTSSTIFSLESEISAQDDSECIDGDRVSAAVDTRRVRSHSDIEREVEDESLHENFVEKVEVIFHVLFSTSIYIVLE